MEFRILGPLEICHEEHRLQLTSDQEKRLLAALLLMPNRVVTLTHLVDAVWADNPPASAKRQVQNRLSALRSRLSAAAGGAGSGLIVAEGPGYRVRVGDHQIDAIRFHLLTAQARRLALTDATESAHVWRRALELWRGPALAGLTGVGLEAGAARLDEQRLVAYEEYFELQLRLDRPREIMGELRELVALNPLRELLVGQLMLALHRSGRRAEALQVFHRLRILLADDLGIDPSGPLQRLQTAILRNEATVPVDGPRPQPPGIPGDGAVSKVAGPVPRQLPAVTSHFVGRQRELRRLDELLEPSGDIRTMVLSAIAGSAGIGKSALAVYWAHRRRESFPDGQFYVNLRGFDPAAAVVAPDQAIRRFLTAMNVSPARIPADLDALTSLYRSELDGRRVLMLLDNARDAEQVRPLLPGTATALVLVTSRDQLPSLVALDGARTLALDLLTDGEARQLLVRRLGAARVAAEPAAVEEIIIRCARLPLALAVAAARAARLTVLLAAVAADLADASGRLDMLSGGDAVSEVRAVFSWSYEALTPAAAELFRLLGLHPGPDISEAAAASLVGLPLTRARSLLAELTRASLLTEQHAGRYTFHDLLRVYAGELARTRDPVRRRAAAINRLVDHYLHTAHAADQLLHPQRDPVNPALDAPAPGVTPEHLADQTQAMTWLSMENSILLAAVGRAAEAGLHSRTWQLAWALTTYLTRRGPWHELAGIWQTALTAAGRLGDLSMQAYAHRLLGQTHTELGRFHAADSHYRQALRLYAEIADPLGSAYTHGNMATLCERQDLREQALEHARQAHSLYRDAGHLRGQAASLNHLGWCRALLGDYQQALDHCRQALPLLQQIGDEHGQADTWDTIGYAHHNLAEHHQAVASYLNALQLYRSLGDSYYEAATLARLGDTHLTAGNHPAARTVWQDALGILDHLNHPYASEVNARLHDLQQGTARQPRDDLIHTD